MNILKIADGFTGLFPKKMMVTLKDELSGGIVGSYKLGVEGLPASFDRPIVMEVDGTRWRVVRVGAYTPRKRVELCVQEEAAFVARKSLVPTVAYPWPSTTTLAVAHDFTLTLRLDEWRQIEFLPAALQEVVEEEMKDVLAVEGGLLGYEWVHVRERIGSPFLGVPFFEFYQLVGGTEKGGVYLEGEGLVEDGFFIRSSDHVYYGIVKDGVIAQLCLREFDSADEEVTRVIEAWDCVVVEWCRGRVA